MRSKPKPKPLCGAVPNLRNSKYHQRSSSGTLQSFIFWRKHRLDYSYAPDQRVYVFSSIFAPTDLKKSIFHRWRRYNDETKEWVTVEDIGYDITGGRDGGFRGYTYKTNVMPGEWEVQVLTEEEQVLGVIGFHINLRQDGEAPKLKTTKF
mgnify:CR=1 FL=1